MGIFTLLNPPLFQGNLKKKRYFEGWYFKHVSEDQEHILSIIPGISLSQNSHAFIQVIHGSSGKTAYVTYPVSLFSPEIMGWYAYVPGMECYHSAVSLDHMLKGELEYNGSLGDFTGGKVVSRKTGADLSLNDGYGCSAIALEKKESL